MPDTGFTGCRNAGQGLQCLLGTVIEDSRGQTPSERRTASPPGVLVQGHHVGGAKSPVALPAYDASSERTPRMDAYPVY